MKEVPLRDVWKVESMYLLPRSFKDVIIRPKDGLCQFKEYGQELTFNHTHCRNLINMNSMGTSTSHGLSST